MNTKIIIERMLSRCSKAAGYSAPQIKAIHANWDKDPKKRAAKKRRQKALGRT